MITHRAVLRPEDVGALVRLASRTGVFSQEELNFLPAIAEDIFQQGEAAGYEVLIAERAGAILGFTIFGGIPATQDRYDLYWIATDPDAQREGIAAELLRRTVTRIKELKGTHLFIETSTRPDYAPAHAFYERQGFPLIAVIPDYHADGDGKAIFGARL
ncbi:MAG: GNAT family N-acetyltransferase [Alphaproteobacteria bacterium]|nr:GNAT family N-acetyltransferase [Alphaproteobacteria bacterium]